MKSLRYLNAILTVLTIVLTLHLWTLWTAPPGAPAGPALVETAWGQGIPDAGAQRKEMIDLLKRLVQRTEELTGLMKSGQVKVQVTNLKDKKSD